MSDTTTVAVIPVGTPLVYFNQWTNFRTDKFDNHIVPMSFEEVTQLEVGDGVYVDVDPMHPNGKVYGWIKAEVSGVQENPQAEYIISYVSPGISGTFRMRGGPQSKFFKAIDEEALAQVVAELPRSQVIFVD